MQRASKQAVEVEAPSTTSKPAAPTAPAPPPTIVPTIVPTPAAAAPAAASSQAPRAEWVTQVVRQLRQRLVSGVPGWEAAAATLTDDQQRLERQLVHPSPALDPP